MPSKARGAAPPYSTSDEVLLATTPESHTKSTPALLLLLLNAEGAVAT